MIESGSKPFWRATIALCIGSFMIFANVYVTQPILPELQREFALTTLEVSWSFTVTTLMLGLSLLFYGPLSDAVGRRPLMLISMAGVCLCTLLLSQADSFSTLVLLRGLQGLFLGGLPAIAIAYMGDEYSRKALMLAVGLYISGNSLGGISGRLIGGFVGEWLGWADLFLVMGVGSCFGLLLFWWLLPASRQFSPQPLNLSAMLSRLWDHLSNPLLLLVYLVGGLNFFIFINQYSYITFVLSDAPYYLSPVWIGLLFLTYLTGTVGSTLSGRLAQQYGQLNCMKAGILILISGSLLTLSSALPLIVTGFFINSFGFFFAHSSASSWVSHQATHARASASSLYLVFYYLGASSGGFYLDPFWHWLGWEGVVLGSVIVLLITLSLTLSLSSLSARGMIRAH
ncbi:MFS transporter, YNFM family, putative membrane transport protein [Amphritea atlantica]|uniref:MFS transporter, YNFM family, putative membrane transport protein n=1 Tax=Amphritea atlantica TaxID=355243 RepID=A0A1H9ERB2_9GAMM|nr:MFS transporter [Amphritea atlantica]SEQ28296.1 MFS transporter, YNFM family, putative membrane transport protein [Amphritea atlantica]